MFLFKLANSDFCSLASATSFIGAGQISVDNLIGRGAYATVEVVRLQRSSCRRALKQLKPAVAENKVELKFFLCAYDGMHCTTAVSRAHSN